MILVLRPEGKAQQSAALLENNGYPAFPLAAISIEKNIEQVEALTVRLMTHSTLPDGLIVTSTYAAETLLSIVQYDERLSSQIDESILSIPVYCVGETCLSMLKHTFKHIYSGYSQNSEGLLAIPQLAKQHTQHKRFYLVKGENGRDLLPNTMRKRNADLSVFDVYKRIPQLDSIRAIDCAKQQIDCIIATSQELCELLLDNQPLYELQSMTWIVVSKRIKQYLESKGINDICLSSGAQPEVLLNCVRQWKEN